MRGFAVPVSFAASLLLAAGAAHAGPASSPLATEALSMEQREELSEQLASSMNLLAAELLRGPGSRAAGWLTTSFSGEVPFGPAPAATALPGGYTRLTYSKTPPAGRAEWLAALQRLLFGWWRVEDVRLKVKAASLTEAGGTADVLLSAQGVASAGGGRAAMRTLLAVQVERAAGAWRWKSLQVKWAEELRQPRPPFVDVAGPAGIARATGGYWEDVRTRGPSHYGQGAAAIDFDADGLMDLFVPSEPLNLLYRNRGDGTFDEMAPRWGVGQPAGGTGVLALDYDNDGRQDLFVCGVARRAGGSFTLWRNTGERFENVTAGSGLEGQAMATSAAAADFDGDGLLDIYVCCYNDYWEVKPSSWLRAANGQPNRLYRNLGGGRFEEVAARAGVADTRWSYAAAWADYDLDGRPDLYVANDYGENALYRNEGAGKFRDVARELGVLDTGAGMGVSWGDLDGDGLLDLHVSNMSSTAGRRILGRLFPSGAEGDAALVIKYASGNSLYRWNGRRFEDRTAAAGIGVADWAWSSCLLDVENDGWLDVFVTNGFISGKTKDDT